MNDAPRTNVHRAPRPAAVTLVVLALLLAQSAACGRSEEPQPGAVEPSAVTTTLPGQEMHDKPGAASLVLGDWEAYPTVAADGEWQKRTLDGPRWAQVTAELACAGRRNRGDPDAQRQLLRNILSHHQTTLEDVANWSARLNRAEPAKASIWALPISEAVRSCR